MGASIERIYKGEDVSRRVKDGYIGSIAKQSGYMVRVGFEVIYISDKALDAARKIRTTKRKIEVGS